MGLIVVKPKEFDVSIYPISSLVTTDGVQYDTEVANATTSYVDLFDIDSDTYFPTIIGKLAWVYVNISFEVKYTSGASTVTFKLEADNKGLDTWTIMSGEPTYAATAAFVGKRLEGYLKLTTDLVDTAPLSLRLQFKASANSITMRLKNDTVIRLVGTYHLE